MHGDDRARFCATCEKHVYDFSKMTAAEGVALIREKEGKLCVRLWRRADGTVITDDCPVGSRRLLQRGSRRLPLLAASLITGALLSSGCALRRPSPTPHADPYTANHGQSTCDPKRHSEKLLVVVGFASAPSGLDPTSTATGMTMDSETMAHLPIR